MAPNLLERIQAKIELFRLEQRYTRRRHRRSTFVSNAIYVDGEYIYQTPINTGSSSGSSARVDALHHEDPTAAMEPLPAPEPVESSTKKRLSRRFSSMPGFGSMGTKQPPPQEDWRPSRASVGEMPR